MTEETRKQILLHLPYLFFVYLFDKIAQGFRLSYGVDFGTRLLHFPETHRAVEGDELPIAVGEVHHIAVDKGHFVNASTFFLKAKHWIF